VLIEFPRTQSGEGVRDMAAVGRDWMAVPRRCVGVLVVLDEAVIKLGPPSEDFRQALADLRVKYEGVLVAHALVFPGTGFAAATVRALLAGLGMVSRTSFAQRIFVHQSEACAWLMSEMDRAGAGCGAAAELMAVVQQVAASRPQAR
jgi:hypothetical protein